MQLGFHYVLQALWSCHCFHTYHFWLEELLSSTAASFKADPSRPACSQNSQSNMTSWDAAINLAIRLSQRYMVSLYVQQLFAGDRATLCTSYAESFFFFFRYFNLNSMKAVQNCVKKVEERISVLTCHDAGQKGACLKQTFGLWDLLHEGMESPWAHDISLDKQVLSRPSGYCCSFPFRFFGFGQPCLKL